MSPADDEGYGLRLDFSNRLWQVASVRDARLVLGVRAQVAKVQVRKLMGDGDESSLARVIAVGLDCVPAARPLDASGVPVARVDVGDADALCLDGRYYCKSIALNGPKRRILTANASSAA